MRKNFFTAFYNALSDPASYLSFQKEMNMKAVEQVFFNTFGGKTTFQAVVLPQDVGIPDALNSHSSNVKAIRIRPLGIYDLIIPEPCSFSDVKDRKRILAMHPVAYPEQSFPVAGGNDQEAVPVATGMVVTCRFSDGPQGGRLRGLVYTKSNLYTSKLNLSCFGDIKGGLKNAFENFAQEPLTPEDYKSPFKGKHAIEKKEKRIKVREGLIKGVGSPIAATNALAEITFWTGKNENDAGTIAKLDKDNPAYRRIQLYNHYKTQFIRKEEGKSSRKLEEYWPSYEEDKKVKTQWIKGSAEEGTGDRKTGIMHWSATSISWVMRDSNFPARSGHSSYTENILSKKSPMWEPHSLIREKVVAQLGDILVRTGTHGKKKTKYTASHGDVVYKISGGFVHVAGGNIGHSGTFKEAAKLKLNPDGTYYERRTKRGDYLIVLKKMK